MNKKHPIYKVFLLLCMLWIGFLQESSLKESTADVRYANQSHPKTITSLDGRRIAGGTRANINDYPSYVKIYAQKVQGGEEYEGCGGSHIASRWILTAAHCLVTNHSGYHQKVHAAVIFWDVRNIVETLRTVQHDNTFNRMTSRDFIIPNKFLYEGDFSYDIALIRLPRESTRTAFIDLPVRDDDCDYYKVGTIATVMGFGDTRLVEAENTTINFSEYLKEIRAKVNKDSFCARRSEEYVPVKQMCFSFDVGEMPGHGDSGGPYITNREDNSQVLLGVHSGRFYNVEIYEQYKRIVGPGRATNALGHLEWIARESGITLPRRRRLRCIFKLFKF